MWRRGSLHAEFAVKELPDSNSAGSIRLGCSNLLSKYMPAEFVSHVTGHILVGVGALFEYVDASFLLEPTRMYAALTCFITFSPMSAAMGKAPLV